MSIRMGHFLADLRFAVRSLRKVPLFTSVAVLSIAFGITANTAVFTLVDQVLLRTLPVDRPSELVQVDAAGTESHGGGMGDGTELLCTMYEDLRDHNDVFAGMFCRFPGDAPGQWPRRERPRHRAAWSRHVLPGAGGYTRRGPAVDRRRRCDRSARWQ